jgi:hypothetical protein
MTNSDPFDFSDFGAPRTPAGPPPASPPGPGGHSAPRPNSPNDGLHTGFDPFAETQPTLVQPRDAFADTDSAGGGLALALNVARPPLALFGLAAVLAVVGIVTAGVWGAALPAAAAGWFLSGPVAIGVLAAYTRVDTRRRSDAVYSAPHWTATLYWAVVAVCMIGIGVGAWQLALWAGRQ